MKEICGNQEMMKTCKIKGPMDTCRPFVGPHVTFSSHEHQKFAAKIVLMCHSSTPDACLSAAIRNGTWATTTCWSPSGTHLLRRATRRYAGSTCKRSVPRIDMWVTLRITCQMLESLVQFFYLCTCPCVSPQLAQDGQKCIGSFWSSVCSLMKRGDALGRFCK